MERKKINNCIIFFTLLLSFLGFKSGGSNYCFPFCREKLYVITQGAVYNFIPLNSRVKMIACGGKNRIISMGEMSKFKSLIRKLARILFKLTKAIQKYILCDDISYMQVVISHVRSLILILMLMLMLTFELII